MTTQTAEIGGSDLDSLATKPDIRKRLAFKLQALIKDVGNEEFAMGEITSLRINQIGGLKKLVILLESDEPMLGYYTQANRSRENNSFLYNR